jgi:hypothetical protein
MHITIASVFLTCIPLLLGFAIIFLMPIFLKTPYVYFRRGMRYFLAGAILIYLIVFRVMNG